MCPKPFIWRVFSFGKWRSFYIWYTLLHGHICPFQLFCAFSSPGKSILPLTLFWIAIPGAVRLCVVLSWKIIIRLTKIWSCFYYYRMLTILNNISGKYSSSLGLTSLSSPPFHPHHDTGPFLVFEGIASEISGNKKRRGQQS